MSKWQWEKSGNGELVRFKTPAGIIMVMSEGGEFGTVWVIYVMGVALGLRFKTVELAKLAAENLFAFERAEAKSEPEAIPAAMKPEVFGIPLSIETQAVQSFNRANMSTGSKAWFDAGPEIRTLWRLQAFTAWYYLMGGEKPL